MAYMTLHKVLGNISAWAQTPATSGGALSASVGSNDPARSAGSVGSDGLETRPALASRSASVSSPVPPAPSARAKARTQAKSAHPVPAMPARQQAQHAAAAELARTHQAVINPHASGEMRFAALMHFCVAHDGSPETLRTFLFPPQQGASPLAQAARALAHFPTENNADGFNLVAATRIGYMNRFIVTPKHLGAGYGVLTEAALAGEFRQALGDTFAALTQAHTYAMVNAETLPPDLRDRLRANDHLSSLLNTGSAAFFEVLGASSTAKLAEPGARPVTDSIDFAHRSIAPLATGSIHPRDAATLFPGVAHSLDILAAETALTTLAHRAGLAIGRGKRCRESLDDFLNDALAKARQHAPASVPVAPATGCSVPPPSLRTCCSSTPAPCPAPPTAPASATSVWWPRPTI